MTHELKTWPEPFQAVVDRRKKHELRRNDRGFQVNDLLLLREWDPASMFYTGRTCERVVTYVTPGGSFGLSEDLCVLSIEPLPARLG